MKFDACLQLVQDSGYVYAIGGEDALGHVLSSVERKFECAYCMCLCLCMSVYVCICLSVRVCV